MSNNNIKVVQLSDYILPIVDEDKNTRKSWVPFSIYTQDDFFSVITKRYTTSPTNQSVIDGITQLLYGNGFHSENESIDTLLYQLTTEEELRNIVFDYYTYGAMSIQCVFDKKGKLVKFYHLPIDTLRADKVDSMGNINGYYYCHDWSNQRANKTYIPVLGSKDYADGNIQVLYHKRRTPGFFYYALPSWFSCLQYCQVEEEISNLHLSNIRNGFNPGAIINFNAGLPGLEEQEYIESSIANKFSGTSNAGKFILSFNSNKEEATTVEKFEVANLHDSYNFLSEECTSKIMLAHRVTSKLLFGIKTATGFSSNADELKTSFDVFQKMVIKPTQNDIIGVLNKLFSLLGIDDTQLYVDQLVPYELEADIKESVGAQAGEDMINESSETVDTQVNDNVNEIVQ